MKNRDLNILVVDGDTRPALAITRSLGAKGHRMVVGAKAYPSLAQVSRHCREFFTYPDPVGDSAGFVDALVRTVRERHIDVVLPVTEITTALLVEQRSEIERYCRVPFPVAATFNAAANKVEVLALAEKLSVPIPLGVVVQRPGGQPQWPDGLQAPIVIKPHRSRIKVDGRWSSTAVAYAEDESELQAVLAAKNPAEYPVLLQQRIVGPGVGVFMCYQRGRLVAQFSHRRLREKPPSGGVSVLCESAPVPPDALRHAQVLLNALQWDGVAMVEFKMDSADQTLKLMEINGRFWGSLQLAIDAGVDFPSLLIQTLADDPMPLLDTYRIGVRSRWLIGDIDALLMRLFKREAELHLPPGHAGKLLSILSFLNSWQKDTYNEVIRFSDLNPAWHELRQWLGV